MRKRVRDAFLLKPNFAIFLNGLKSHHSILRYINALVTEGYIKFREKQEITDALKLCYH